MYINRHSEIERMYGTFPAIDCTNLQAVQAADQSRFYGQAFSLPAVTHFEKYPKRIVAFGNTGGDSETLKRLVDRIAPSKDDLMVFLGGYLNCYSGGGDVLRYLLEVQRSFPDTVFLRGDMENSLMELFYMQHLLKADEVCFASATEALQEMQSGFFSRTKSDLSWYDREFWINLGGCYFIAMLRESLKTGCSNGGYEIIPAEYLAFISEMPVVHQLKILTEEIEREFIFSHGRLVPGSDLKACHVYDFLYRPPLLPVPNKEAEAKLVLYKQENPVCSLAEPIVQDMAKQKTINAPTGTKTMSNPIFVHSHQCAIGVHKKSPLVIPVCFKFDRSTGATLSCCDVLNGGYWLST